MQKKEPISLLKIVAVGVLILILALLLYNPQEILRGFFFFL